MLPYVELCHQCGVSLSDGDRFCRHCGASVAADEGPGDPLIGRVIGGSYVVQDLVGVGGMGRVYRAEQRMLGRTVAIKVVHPHLLSDEQSVARFYTEARAASRLNHPNSVSIIDFGRTDDGILYLVMEFLNGKDLSRLVHDEGPLPFPRICGIVTGVLGALGEAHALEVVHRDLKPENVIIEPMRSGGDLIKVVDFGLAKLMGGSQPVDSSITLPGLVCGTPDYMSPEQGRGEEVDGRGDLYATGVLLFELLTEQLPFAADTPTNVVLRHIQDPVPDPREVAPGRGIPTALAEVTMTALAKRREDRYQTADEMAAALRQAERQLTPSTVQVRCPTCTNLNPSSARFCADCGASLQPVSAPLLSVPPPMQLGSSRGRLVAREAELARIDELRVESRDGLRCVQLLGEAGIGKTRMLAEIADRAATAGDVVVGAGPHPLGAPVPYYAIRRLVDGLIQADDEGLRRMALDLASSEPTVSAGLSELERPTGMVGAEGKSRASAVAAALAHVVRQAQSRAGAPGTVLMLDDLHLCDGLTRLTLERLSSVAPQIPVLLVAAGPSRRDAVISRDTELFELRGVTVQEAEAIISGAAPSSRREPDPDDQLMLPLYVEYLKDLGVRLDDPQRPARLADVVMQRLQRLPVGAAHLMQAICVEGMYCDLSRVEAIGATPDPHALEVLRARGLVEVSGWQVEVSHPFVRDLVEGSIPAEARKELHAKALAVAKEADEPLEVCAHHAYGSGEVLGALVLLERMADVADARGDLRTAVLGYRRALELARRELFVSGDSYLEAAIESVSSRLGRVLARRGDIAGAEGVLREAMEYSAPHSVQRAHIQIGLASVLSEKKRVREAYRLLGQALETAIQLDSEAAQVDVQIAVARLRRAERNYTGAAAALSVAHDLLGDDPDRLKAAVVALELARVRVDAGDAEVAGAALAEAEIAADQADAPFLGAQVAALEARLAAATGDDAASRAGYAEAARQSAMAGDVEMSQRFGRLARGSGAPPEAAASGL